MPQACHGSIINGTSLSALHNDHQQGRRTNDSQEDDGPNDIMEEASEMMFHKQGDANDNNVDDIPKHKGPIMMSMRRISDHH